MSLISRTLSVATAASVVLALAAPSVAAAARGDATRHVDADAREGGDGSAARPFTSLEAALADGARTVVVQPASRPYRWDLSGQRSGGRVTVRAAGGRVAVDQLDANGVAGLHLEGFAVSDPTMQIRGAVDFAVRDSQLSGQLQFFGGSGITVEGNTIRNGGGRGLLLSRQDDTGRTNVRDVVVRRNDIQAKSDGIQGQGADHVVIEGNDIHDLRGGYHPDGIQIMWGSDWVIRGNTIRNYDHQGIMIAAAVTAPGFGRARVDDILIEGNQISNGKGVAINLGGKGDGRAPTNVVIRGNSGSGNRGGGVSLDQ